MLVHICVITEPTELSAASVHACQESSTLTFLRALMLCLAADSSDGSSVSETGNPLPSSPPGGFFS